MKGLGSSCLEVVDSNPTTVLKAVATVPSQVEIDL
jgi:hypothetical protein